MHTNRKRGVVHNEYSYVQGGRESHAVYMPCVLPVTCHVFYQHRCVISNNFAEIHRSLVRKVEKILNSSLTEFYNSDDVNSTTADVWQRCFVCFFVWVVDLLFP